MTPPKRIQRDGPLFVARLHLVTVPESTADIVSVDLPAQFAPDFFLARTKSFWTDTHAWYYDANTNNIPHFRSCDERSPEPAPARCDRSLARGHHGFEIQY